MEMDFEIENNNHNHNNNHYHNFNQISDDSTFNNFLQKPEFQTLNDRKSNFYFLFYFIISKIL